MIAADALRRGRRSHLRTGVTGDGLVVAVFALVGLRLGLSPLRDNSAFTHLATGIRMVDDGWLPAIPRVDPYSFTAAGAPWVVQSWLPSAAVGWVYRLVGEHGVTLLSGLTMAALAALMVSLARTGRPLRTALAGLAALLVGLPLWAPRPLLVGLLCLALTIWIVERGVSPCWLVPVVWVWVNSHGSFPLGMLWLALACVADRQRLRYGGAFAVGLVVSALNPLGPRLLTFPLTVLEKREVFGRVVEWGPPDFTSVDGVCIVSGLVLAAALCARSGRLDWRELVPVVVFLPLGLLAERNLAACAVVLAPVLGRALRVESVAAGSDSGERRRVAAVGLSVAAVAVTVMALQAPLVDASGYPVAAIRWLEDQGRFDAPHRVVIMDRVANYLELRRGPRREVFVDDRVDMFPIEVTRDYIAMVDGTDRGLRALDRWKVDTVLWRRGERFEQRLLQSGEWKVAIRRSAYVVLIRRTN